MAIASTDPDSTANPPPKVVLAIVRAPTDDLGDLEKRMRQNELTILQKKELDINLEEMQPWFADPLEIGSEITSTGYVIQGQDAANVWKEFTTEVGNNTCGMAPEEELRRLFPGYVVDQYLLQPDWTTKYLNQLKPTIMAGLEQICMKKPEDPIQHLADFLGKAKNK